MGKTNRRARTAFDHDDAGGVMDITGISSVLDFGGKLIDRIWPNPAERDAAKLELFKAEQAGEFKELDQAFQLAQGQIGVNAVEAANPRLFVSGGRPFIIWICGIALAYAAIMEPVARFVAMVIYHYAGTFPAIDTTITLQVLLGLLGLGGMRSWEKGKGVA
jgi:hypothetical protein